MTTHHPDRTSSIIISHAYVSRETRRVHSHLGGTGAIEPGSSYEIEAARCAPAGTDLVDVSGLDRMPEVGDELRIDSTGCATAIVE